MRTLPLICSLKIKNPATLDKQILKKLKTVDSANNIITRYAWKASFFLPRYCA